MARGQRPVNGTFGGLEPRKLSKIQRLSLWSISRSASPTNRVLLGVLELEGVHCPSVDAIYGETPQHESVACPIELHALLSSLLLALGLVLISFLLVLCMCLRACVYGCVCLCVTVVIRSG